MERARASAAPVDRGDRPAPATTVPVRPRVALRRRARTRGPGPRARAALAAAALTVAGLALPAAAGAAGGGSSGTDPGPGLTLLHASWTVGPGQPFTATVGVPAGSAARGMGLRIALYSPLHTRTALSEWIGGTPVGIVTYQSSTVPLASLPSPAPGEVQVTLALASPDDPAPSTAGATAGPARLDCPGGLPGTCGGVYPVSLELTGASGTVSTLGTELVFAYPPGNPYHATSPLRLATVVPLGLPPTAGDASPAPAALTQLAKEATATAAGAAAGVPLTLVPEPRTVTRLAAAGTGHGAHQASAALAAAAADPAHQVLVQGYVPVDASALVGSGLAAELGQQQARACGVLAGLHPTTGTWVSDAVVDPAAAAALSGSPCDPVHQLVVPAGSVTGYGCSITCASPFRVTAAGGATMTAVEADAQLATELTGSSADPVLRAHDLVADLSLTYYEAPTPVDPRGVVLAVPDGATVSPTEMAAVLSGVAADPVLAPVTLAQYFADVPVGANGQPAERRLDGSSAALPVAVARALRSGRSALDSFGGAVGASTAGAQAVTSLGDRLLAAESSLLRPPQQERAAAAFRSALQAQLARITLSKGSIRLTSSSTLRVPITFASTTGFPVAARLQVSSDKLLFTPGGGCRGINPGPAGFNGLRCAVDLSKPTNAVYVAIRARLGGDFRVAVSLLSPDGQLALVQGTITVRSLSTSVEAVVLSIAAVIVLLSWWARTWWRGRRRGRHSRGAAPGSPGTPGAPGGSRAPASAGSGR